MLQYFDFSASSSLDILKKISFFEMFEKSLNVQDDNHLSIREYLNDVLITPTAKSRLGNVNLAYNEVVIDWRFCLPQEER